MIKKMKGSGKEYGHPGLIDGQHIITSSIGKAEIMAKTFSKVHSTENLRQQVKWARAETVENYKHEFENVDVIGGVLNDLFTITELNNALRKLGKSSPGGMVFVILCWRT